MSRIRPATTYQKRAAATADRLLRDALQCARVANCPKLIRRIQLAITSAGGAVRHVNHRASRTDPRGLALDTHGKPYGTTRITDADRAAFANVEPGDLPARAPKSAPHKPRALWFRAGQFA